MLRGNSRHRVKHKPLNGWVAGKDHPQPIRRRLRDATVWDRALIAVFFFVTGAIATGAIYWYLSGDSGYSSSYRSGSRPISSTIVTPFESLTGDAARNHFLLVCLAGGVVAAIAYVFISIFDPYGTTAAAKAEEKRKRDRFEFLKQAGYPVDSPENSSRPTEPEKESKPKD